MDNPQAFPNYASLTGDKGMTLRDYFAGQALISLNHQIDHLSDLKYRAKLAYDIADAMLQQRTQARER